MEKNRLCVIFGEGCSYNDDYSDVLQKSNFQTSALDN